MTTSPSAVRLGVYADVRRARYAALRALLDEATENASTHSLHARL